MFQKFNENTIMGRFIKNLLSTSRIPTYDFITDGDVVVQNAIYIYKNFIIKVLTGGKLFADKQDVLYPGKTIYPSIALFPGTGVLPASFEVLGYFNPESKNYTYSYKSNKRYYDETTHMHLGDYLRYLSNTKDVDLMRYYNCYTQQYTDEVRLVRGGVMRDGRHYYLNPSDSDMSSSKVAMIPVKFNKKYTVAIDCSEPVQVMGIILGKSGLVNDVRSGNPLYSPFSDKIDSSYVEWDTIDFLHPKLYEISSSTVNVDAHNHPETLFNQQRNLYMLIQLPRKSESSIVVLEGDYTSCTNQPSLLRFNCRTSFAFSDSLIGHLLLNTIYNGDEIVSNVARVQSYLMKINDKFRAYMTPGIGLRKTLNGGKEVTLYGKLGVWDSETEDAIDVMLSDMSYKHDTHDTDVTGSKRVEELLWMMGAI
jgi:hypothetical protein